MAVSASVVSMKELPPKKRAFAKRVYPSPIHLSPEQVSKRPPLLPLPPQVVSNYSLPAQLLPLEHVSKKPRSSRGLLGCSPYVQHIGRTSEQISNKPPILPLPAQEVCQNFPQIQLPPPQGPPSSLLGRAPEQVSKKPPLLPLPTNQACEKPARVQSAPQVSRKPPLLPLPTDQACEKPARVQSPPPQVSRRPPLLPLPTDQACEKPARVRSPPSQEQVSKKPRCEKRKSCLPRGWFRCPPYGQPIDHIIPSKVPVSEYFDEEFNKEPTTRYPLQKFLNLGSERKEIGLVINMTNGGQYYQPLDWIEKGIKHVKIACKGKNCIPDNTSVNKFVFQVLKFMSEGQSKYILVHCTHGYNNTGYMIVHYLMRTRSVSVTAALDIFAKARPPGIFKQNYIDALYAFYHESKPQTVVCPSAPEWKNCLYPIDLNTKPMDDNYDDEDDGGGNAPVCQSEEIHVMKDDDKLGDAITNEQQAVLRETCYRLLKLDKGKKGYLDFPGSHPVSLTRNNLELLRKQYYYVTWNAVGTRYMMLITWDGCYLIDENFCLRRVQMRFPLKKTETNVHKETHNFTLLDGEMVIDTLPETGKQKRRYLIHDLMAINNVSIAHLPFHERWKMLEKQVIEPRNLEMQYIKYSRNPNYRYDMETFRVRRKDFWPLSTVSKILLDFVPKLSHEADGLIFQCWDDPYVPHNHAGLFKWQYNLRVDFLFEIDKNHRQLLFLLERKQKKLMEGNQIVFDKDSDPSEFSGRIIQCSPVSTKVWKFLCIKTDKTVPYNIRSCFEVIKSMKIHITKNLLMNEATEIVRHPTYTYRQKRNDNSQK
ncbi:hypothetical protein AQUCO_01500093v1 [Aquilegia coerulea]|uniref:mRNA guanylyltransferase n=1 Tax=Aquilegia coerulea TaxID=218851 RepID=A0A2G5DS30_AQUCA|nr:hypothetical protein AQUCO_01500093v1 [Aquilegia coerulea]